MKYFRFCNNYKIGSKFHLISIFFFIYLVPFQLLSQEHDINIALLKWECSDKADQEIKAAFDFMADNKKVSPSYLQFDRSITQMDLGGFDIIWFHKNDSLNFTEEQLNKNAIDALLNYVSNGGNLFLSLDAFRYLNDLGIEQAHPSIKYIKAVDNGYGRKLGLHSFRTHPVFNGLFGGAYIFSPERDLTTRQVGFFDGSFPKNGKVVAVDWAYINLKEESKLAVEYDYGKGKIFAVGAYLYFNLKDASSGHLELFTQNIFEYLSGEMKGEEAHYWNYYSVPKSEKVKSFDRNLTGKNEITSSKSWRLTDDRMDLNSSYGTENSWDVAGEQILVMGKEKGGIEEIWAHPFMALRDFESGVQFSYDDSLYWLGDKRPEITVNPASFSRQYKFRRAFLKEVIIADPHKPVSIIHYEYRGVYSAKIVIKFNSNLRFMWPYSSESIGGLRYSYNDDLNAFMIKDRAGEFAVVVGTNKKLSGHLIGQVGKFSFDSTVTAASSDSFIVGAALQIGLKMNDNFDVIIAASNDGLEKCIDEYKKAAADPIGIYNSAFNFNREFLNASTNIITPDKNFNLGYQWALIGANRFFVKTPGMGGSFTAGYSTTATGWDGGQKVNGRPGYGWYFGRDGAWSGFAVLNYGDFEKVKSMLEFFQRYQDLSGKIFHELTTSGAVHFDAADATPLYIILAGKYLRYSGDVEFIRESWENIKSAIDFCFSTDTDGDHLIENTNVGHGWIEGGALYGAHSTLYLSSCWAEALEEASNMAGILGYIQLSEKYKNESENVVKIINNDFWNTSNQCFNYGKLLNGNFNPVPTVLEAIPILFGQTDKSKALHALDRFAGLGFSADWGVRIISEDSPLYNPRGYHSGSVWPLFTGWTAMSEYRYGNSLQGFSHIMNNLNVYNNWALGFIEEVLNGEIFQPSGVCSHQCWSETMVLQPVIEGLIGFRADAIKNKIRLAPNFPADWDSVNIENLRVADCLINLDFKRSGAKTIFTFLSTGGNDIAVLFEPYFPPGSKFSRVLLNGTIANFENLSSEQNAQLLMSFKLSGKTIVQIDYLPGISLLPIISNPKPGYRSEAAKIIKQTYVSENLKFILEGRGGSSHIIKLYNPAGKIESILNGDLIENQKSIYSIKINFNGTAGDYVRKTVVVKIKK